MVIVVSGGTISLGEPEDFKRFSVAATPGADVGGVLAVSKWGWADSADEGEVWIRAEAVRDAVGPQPPSGWTAQFDKMLEFARSKGWLSADGEGIRAHVEVL
jgi:hypothetical protein